MRVFGGVVRRCDADLMVLTGVDMIAAFIEERFPHPLSMWSRIGLDVDPHVIGQDYQEPAEMLMAKLGPKN